MAAAALYIAGTGVITAVGGNTSMTAAAVQAGISGYGRSDRFYSNKHQAITMACVPDELLDRMQVEIQHGDTIDEFHERIVKLALLGIHEACDQAQVTRPIALLLATPDPTLKFVPLPLLARNLVRHGAPWIDSQHIETFPTGRAAGIQAIARAFERAETAQYILIGGSDSFCSQLRLAPLDDEDRLLTQDAADGFAPGEGAGFVLLTPNIDLALSRNGHVVALHPPGLAEEPGHLQGDEPYRGDGLDQAVKGALKNESNTRGRPPIERIYSSMNGEHYWAKELGVAQLRNRAALSELLNVEHPADCLGDLGAATAPVLIALAANHLLNHGDAHVQLVCSSSDTAQRGAVVLEKRRSRGKEHD